MRYEIRYRLTPQMALQEEETWARLFCGVGAGKGDVDLTALQDGRKKPFLPGATIKGLIREKYIDLMEACGLKLDPRGKDKDFRHLRTHPLVTAVFGSPGQSEAMSVFSDLRPLHDESLSFPLKRNRIDRRLGRPADQALFGVEYLLCLSFEGTIRLWLPSSAQASQAAQAAQAAQASQAAQAAQASQASHVDLAASMLLGAVKLLFAVGGHTSTGAGLVKVEVVRLGCDGRFFEMATPEGQEVFRGWLAPLGGGEELRSALEMRSQAIKSRLLPMASAAYHFGLASKEEEGGA